MAVAQRSGRFFAPCVRSVSAHGENCANATLNVSANFSPMRVALAQKLKNALTLRHIVAIFRYTTLRLA
jgi:hypothetical protein